MSVDHYENFPVASWLCPPALRPAVRAIYHFARTADDIADEGEATAGARLAELRAYRDDLAAVANGAAAPSGRWPRVFGPLAEAITAYRLPHAPLDALLAAFMQDAVKTRYEDREEVLDYCRRSANPVGQLLLHLYGVDDAVSRRQSDAICTALQLANFWQDLGVDAARGRLYTPLADCRRHGVSPDDLVALRDSADVHALVGELVGWARSLMLTGADLVHAVPGRAGLELRLVVQGGLRILERVELLHGATLRERPTLGARDAPVVIWRALTMRAAPAGIGQGRDGLA